jgi:hypothetical protein
MCRTHRDRDRACLGPAVYHTFDTLHRAAMASKMDPVTWLCDFVHSISPVSEQPCMEHTKVVFPTVQGLECPCRVTPGIATGAPKHGTWQQHPGTAGLIHKQGVHANNICSCCKARG